jgi:iron(III) transport system ATP-binding protein
MRIHRATGATSVYVTHDQVEAMTMATHVALLRDGRVEQFGHPHELLANPTSSFVATFVGTPPANVVRGVVDADRVEVDGVAVCPPPRGAGRDHLDLLYRAEALDLVAGDGPRTLRCEFSEATPLAGRWVVACHTGSTRLSVVVDEEPRARLGDTVWVRFPEEPEAVFDIETGARVDAGVEAVAS